MISYFEFHTFGKLSQSDIAYIHQKNGPCARFYGVERKNSLMLWGYRGCAQSKAKLN